MNPVHPLKICLILATIALLASPAALAQTSVQTRLELTTEDDEDVREWDGGDLEIGFQARLCWEDAGGINPDDDEFNISLEAQGAEQVNVTVDPENATIAPPSGPTDGPDCTDPVDFTLTLQADESLEANQTLNVTVTVMETDGQAVGTFEPPEEDSASVEVTVSEDFDPEDPVDPLDPGDDDEEGTPGPAVVVFLAVLGFLLARTRSKGRRRR